MEAEVTKPFKGVPDGEIHPRWFAKGEKVTGSLAEVAVAEGWATSGKAPLRTKDSAPSETKSGSVSQAGRPSRKQTLSSSVVKDGSQ